MDDNTQGTNATHINAFIQDVEDAKKEVYIAQGKLNEAIERLVTHPDYVAPDTPPTDESITSSEDSTETPTDTPPTDTNTETEPEADPAPAEDSSTDTTPSVTTE